MVFFVPIPPRTITDRAAKISILPAWFRFFIKPFSYLPIGQPLDFIHGTERELVQASKKASQFLHCHWKLIIFFFSLFFVEFFIQLLKLPIIPSCFGFVKRFFFCHGCSLQQSNMVCQQKSLLIQK